MKRALDEVDSMDRKAIIISPRRSKRQTSPVPFMPISALNGSIFEEEPKDVMESDNDYSEVFLALLRKNRDLSASHNRVRRLSFDETDNEDERHQNLRSVLSNLNVCEAFPAQGGSYFSPFEAKGGSRLSLTRSRPSTPSTIMSPHGEVIVARPSPRMQFPGEIVTRSPVRLRERNSFLELYRQFASPTQFLQQNFLHYNIISSLGKGFTSEVYKVEDPTTFRTYAIKRSKQDSGRADDISRERKAFLLEVETLYSLNRSACPNITRIFNAWEEESHFYLLMECGICCLQNIIAKHGKQQVPVPQHVVAHIVFDIAHALEHIHGLGIVHLDIKPDNMLIADNGVVKLADFGQAHVPGKADGCEGDHRYIAKEVPVPLEWCPQPSADIFSLGVSLYNLCLPSYVLPREGSEWIALRSNAFPPLPPYISGSLCDLICSMLSAEPQFRPTAAQIRAHEDARRCDMMQYLSTHNMLVDDVPPLIELNRSASFTSSMAAISSL